MKPAIHTNRTQISLSPTLLALIKSRGKQFQESLSEYLRKAALIRMAIEDTETNNLEFIAESVVGKVSKSKSGWKNVKDISKWQSQQRAHEDKHSF